MKLLSIGNEFSREAHMYLPHLAAAGGKELLLGNLFLPDASAEDHYRNFIDENEVYIYETYLPGTADCLRPDGIALHEAVEDDDWDIITIQQSAALSGISESYSPYTAELAEYCRMMHPGAKIMLHQTRAYESSCTRPEFKNDYESSPERMYEMLTECYIHASAVAQTDGIIPVGKAWNFARQTKLKDKLTIDGFAANEAGAFLSGCCFYEAVFDEDVRNNSFFLPDYDINVSNLIKVCAHLACEEGIE